ncbi:MAG: hypothetical protein COB02_07015 [Candidatus Cloacimonadota bacterium]|nr:MAG: hypothetical protein COB02_07015 [Candidatus Cloacimonadota bacterium]
MFFQLLNIIPIFLGLILLYTASSKANFSKPFFNHLRRSGFESIQLCSLLVLIVVFIESTLGFLLILSFKSSLVISLTLLLFCIFTLSSIYNKKRGLINSCSCYGQMLPLSIDQSIKINVFYMLSLIVYRVNLIEVQTKINDDIILYAGAFSIFLVFCTSRSSQKPFFNLSPLQVNKKVPSVISSNNKNYILAFMNPDCEDCIKWLKSLKNLHNQKMKILVLVAKESPKNRLFYKYDLQVLKPLYYYWLVYESPSIFYIKESKISQKFDNIDSIESFSKIIK